MVVPGGRKRTKIGLMTILAKPGVKLRPLERDDLHFVHQLDNNSHIMRYWFEEPDEAYAELATRLAIEYAFCVLNLHKLCLYVDSANLKAMHIYSKCGFAKEGELKSEFFVNGEYRDAIRMCMFQAADLATQRR